ncbi:MAG: bifunctional diaminohydroxyphosphoribosylaminopyrimidine deaminase/5-amino-6-(5-phosphoribosylamino)uracil reductase RibD [Bacteroidetes bacterium]|nr:bifunctional diaminohydroxyphosphoribosylaminopyrimidine deaminase/5-amino-6-(5-phosphoribosylamino)uracil reductase RibD [Bacteroidota bacterium]
MTIDEKYIKRCLELAKLGTGSVSPNPMVGSVVVHNNCIIGEGWHQKYGEAHAEVNAINSVKDKSLLESSTIYVSLEPCFHFGQTPPCVDLILKHKIPKVIIASIDCNSKVAGKSIEKLRTAGVHVEVGVLEKEALALNKYFFTSIQKQRPYIILKWAESKDGYFAPHKGQQWLSNPLSKRLTHKWRNEIDAILIGKNTLIEDNPALTDRFWEGHQPIKVIIDPSGDLYKGKDDTKTIIFNGKKSTNQKNIEYINIQSKPFSVHEMMNHLHRRKITSVLVEGGATTIQHFLKAELWDEAYIYETEVYLKEGIPSPKIEGFSDQTTIQIADNRLKIIQKE